uniref:Uncharacterized protein n=1 Tax=viral metagenome TaxID=1070528 RepID=A0A6M3X5Z0_9ZZZZ
MLKASKRLISGMACVKCVYGLTSSYPDRSRCDECLANNYSRFEAGDPRDRLLKLQRSGEINIVVGGEGEHEVNANWTMAEAYKHLANVCEDCGGLVTHDGFTKLLLMKPYGPNYVLDWMHGKLYKISIQNHKVVWESE